MTAFAVSAPSSQWLFPITALQQTPSVESGFMTIEKELYDRARGAEFLFRLGSSLGLPTAALMTAATWFHRFYMRFSMEDYHRQDVAAACIFLATKTEECGRKLRDVAKICYSKATGSGQDPSKIPPDHPEIERTQNNILQAEEALLEALCFDFVVDTPHYELTDVLDGYADDAIREYAWSMAHDTYRTPLCVLFPARIIAASCYVLAQSIAEGRDSAPLDARISYAPPNASLLSPPRESPSSSPLGYRVVIELFRLEETDCHQVAEALNILHEFYRAQDTKKSPYLFYITAVTPPKTISPRESMYPHSFTTVANWPGPKGAESLNTQQEHVRTPSSAHGDVTSAPVVKASKGWIPVGGEPKARPTEGLDSS